MLGTTRCVQANFPESHIIDPLLLTNRVRSRWRDIDPFFFWRVYGPQLRQGLDAKKKKKKKT